MTSLLRQNDVMTSFWRYNDVIITLCVQGAGTYLYLIRLYFGICYTPHHMNSNYYVERVKTTSMECDNAKYLVLKGFSKEK